MFNADNRRSEALRSAEVRAYRTLHILESHIYLSDLWQAT